MVWWLRSVCPWGVVCCGTCALPVEEFIRRFLQHVLPNIFVKVRYYGFLRSGLRQRLTALRQQLGHPPTDPPPVSEGTDVDTQTADHVADDSAPDHVVRCPSCGRFPAQPFCLKFQIRVQYVAPGLVQHGLCGGFAPHESLSLRLGTEQLVSYSQLLVTKGKNL
jgi:hypothetical protein